MVEEIGKYNIDYEGAAYDDDGTKYSMVIISKFAADKETARKVFYFLGVAPKFHNEKEIDEIFLFPNYSKLKINHYLTIEKYEE